MLSQHVPNSGQRIKSLVHFKPRGCSGYSHGELVVAIGSRAVNSVGHGQDSAKCHVTRLQNPKMISFVTRLYLSLGRYGPGTRLGKPLYQHRTERRRFRGNMLIGIHVLLPQEHGGVMEIKEEYDPSQDFGGRKKGGWGSRTRLDPLLVGCN